ncbi:MAG: hypothetical protein PXZ08_12275 [Actinomycetota bacterium]|nr:hypothetical protein [Actinomycetota bacterium]
MSTASSHYFNWLVSLHMGHPLKEWRDRSPTGVEGQLLLGQASGVVVYTIT